MMSKTRKKSQSGIKKNNSDQALATKAAISKSWPTLDEFGNLRLYGWALSPKKIEEIRISVNGKFLGLATLGLQRTDVFNNFPEYNNLSSGFCFEKKLSDISPGGVTVKVEVLSNNKIITTIQKVIPTVDTACINVNEVEAAHQDSDFSYKAAAHKLFYRAIFNSGEPLSDKDYEEIEKNEELFITLVLLRNDNFRKYMCKKYHFDEEIIDYLFEMDFNTFQSLLKRDPATIYRFESLSTRVLSRFRVHKRNFDTIKQISEFYNVPRHAFFDVGCLFGFSMISAAVLGYKFAYGCDNNRNLYARARDFMKLIEGSKHTNIKKCNLKYFESDFLNLDLEKGFYNLVFVSNVLEHTSDLEATIRQISHMLAEDGICYILLDSPKSLQRVLEEPHYRLPLLTILPKKMVINILRRLKRIAADEDYVVTEWPDYKALFNLFEKYKLDANIPLKDHNFFRTQEPIPYEKAAFFQERIYEEAKARIYPVLNKSEIKQVERITGKYFKEVEKAIIADNLEAKLTYFTQSWNIIARKKKPMSNIKTRYL